MERDQISKRRARAREHSSSLPTVREEHAQERGSGRNLGSLLEGVTCYPDQEDYERSSRSDRRSQNPPTLTSERSIHAAEPDHWVTLARGANSLIEAQGIQDNETAGASSSARSDGLAPSNQTAIDVVAFEAAPWARSQPQTSQPGSAANTVEYTTNLQIAQQFGRRGGVVVIKIQRKYLVKGSTTENGWICFKDAPVEVLAYQSIPKV